MAQIKDIDPQVETVYIKPPAKRSIEDVVRFADVSFNIERYTIELLFAEALRQQKTHRVIIMVELGDLREGIMGCHLRRDSKWAFPWVSGGTSVVVPLLQRGHDPAFILIDNGAGFS